MIVEVDKLRSLERWRQKRPDLYAQARARKDNEHVTCPVCEGRYPIIDVLFPGEKQSERVLCVCWSVGVEDQYRELVDRVNQRPADLGFKTFADLKKRGTAEEWATIEQIIAALKDIAKHPYEHQWLFIWGPPGCGKTHLVTAGQALMPHVAAYVSADALADQIHYALKDHAVSDYMEDLVAVPVLILDDLGADYANSEFAMAQISTVVNRRYMYGKKRPTILASNLGTKTLNQRYPRLASRVLDKELSERVDIPLWDYRQYLKDRPKEEMRDETLPKPSAHGKVHRHKDTRDEKVEDSL